MKKIEELSKKELLSLIYHNLPRTVFFDHPVQCGSCGTEPFDNFVKINDNYFRQPMGYICDRCNSEE